MNSFKTYTILVLSLVIVSCAAEKNAILFQIKTDGNQFKQNESMSVAIANLEEKDIQSVIYSIDGKELPETGGQITLAIDKLGNKTLTAKISYDDTSTIVTKNIKVLAEKSPDLYTYEILNEYPHDNKAYTQGLEFHNDTLYEGTGQKGRSFLRKFDFKTGKVHNQIDLDESIFGEGITIMNGKIYQLSWQSGIGFIYDLYAFKKTDNFQYGKSKEGWGLANDGNKIYKSDGTEKIWLLNPETLQEEGYIETVTDKSVFNRANELEFVDGKIYANVYQKSGVMIIDATSGAIEGVVNFGGLSEKITKTPDWNVNNVLNGIAYHPTRKTFFVTGKDWDKLFEVKIMKK
jgi:glutamine cyclotransferase